ncbi:helix-turn-helix domain-containing protein [Brevibacillus laterosporus]|uniref:helix-turn-helix domain-containing protein n=2 Tax=Brevibacillus laterosporus TaxID=1465 RepID=UPI0022A69496|nr:helix-turn-helix transcriptional regulator [Brevibacillus laterosporus]
MKRIRMQLERKKAGKTQEQVALETGYSSVFIRKLEYGTENPGRDTIFILSGYYGVSPQELFPDIFLALYDRIPIKR